MLFIKDEPEEVIKKNIIVIFELIFTAYIKHIDVFALIILRIFQTI